MTFETRGEANKRFFWTFDRRCVKITKFDNSEDIFSSGYPILPFPCSLQVEGESRYKTLAFPCPVAGIVTRQCANEMAMNVTFCGIYRRILPDNELWQMYLIIGMDIKLRQMISHDHSFWESKNLSFNPLTIFERYTILIRIQIGHENLYNPSYELNSKELDYFLLFQFILANVSSKSHSHGNRSIVPDLTVKGGDNGASTSRTVHSAACASFPSPGWRGLRVSVTVYTTRHKPNTLAARFLFTGPRRPATWRRVPQN